MLQIKEKHLQQYRKTYLYSFVFCNKNPLFAGYSTQLQIPLISAIVCPNLLNFATADALVRLHLDNTFHLHSNGDANKLVLVSSVHRSK